MEPTQLQLAFNVVAITGVTSLASFCFLLKKENRKLASKLGGENKQEDPGHAVEVVHDTVPTTDKDIRAFAADQRSKWVDGMRLSATLWSAGK